MMFGGRTAYIALYALVIAPFFSYAVTLIFVRRLTIKQTADNMAAVKGEAGAFTLSVANPTPIVFGNAEYVFSDDCFAADIDFPKTLTIAPFSRGAHTIGFKFKCRGEYNIGLRAIKVKDMFGLFTVKKRISCAIKMTVYPKVPDMSNFPAAINMLPQPGSNSEIQEEDYETVSDIRKYAESDSVKRVHWKLSAKRGEWIVKRYNTNAADRVTFIIGGEPAARPTVSQYGVRSGKKRAAARAAWIEYETALLLEDRVIETALAALGYYLKKHTDVNFIAGSLEKDARTQADFIDICESAAGPVFDGAPGENEAAALLGKLLYGCESYANVVIFTSKLDARLSGAIINANNIGHNASLFYFPAEPADEESEKTYKFLKENGAAAYII